MPYPHGADCKCPALPADAGLLAFTVDCEHHAELTEALKAIDAGCSEPEARAILRLAPEQAGCDGSMTCECSECGRERAARVRQGVRRVRQPWELAA